MPMLRVVVVVGGGEMTTGAKILMLWGIMTRLMAIVVY